MKKTIFLLFIFYFFAICCLKFNLHLISDIKEEETTIINVSDNLKKCINKLKSDSVSSEEEIVFFNDLIIFLKRVNEIKIYNYNLDLINRILAINNALTDYFDLIADKKNFYDLILKINIKYNIKYNENNIFYVNDIEVNKYN